MTIPRTGMAKSIGHNSRNRAKSTRRKNGRRRDSVQKPNGTISKRVKKVGADKFAVVCIDPAKHRSEWMMADYFGNVLLEPSTLERQVPHFAIAVQKIPEAQREHGIVDLIVTVERTGNYHVAPQRAFSKAGFETRIIHPFATKQYRLPADPGNKTDPNDLSAQLHPLERDLAGDLVQTPYVRLLAIPGISVVSAADSIMEKLRAFHHEHDTPLDRVLSELEAAVDQLPFKTRNHEAEIVAEVLNQQTRRRRGPVQVGELLPAVLARLGVAQQPKTTGTSVPDSKYSLASEDGQTAELAGDLVVGIVVLVGSGGGAGYLDGHGRPQVIVDRQWLAGHELPKINDDTSGRDIEFGDPLLGDQGCEVLRLDGEAGWDRQIDDHHGGG